MPFNLGSLFSNTNASEHHSSDFDPNQRYTNMKIKSISRRLQRYDRKKFKATMEDKIKIGRTMSAREILKAVDKDYGFRFKKKVKDVALTEHEATGLSPRQIKRNLLRSKYERLRDEEREAKGSHDHHSIGYNAEDGPRTTFYQPGSKEPTDKDASHSEPTHTTGLFNPNV